MTDPTHIAESVPCCTWRDHTPGPCGCEAHERSETHPSGRLPADYVAIGQDKRASGVSEDDLVAAASKPVPAAESERVSYGFDGLRNGAFPPVYIYRWVNWQTVSTEQLIGELRFWANHLESKLAEQSDGSACAT